MSKHKKTLNKKDGLFSEDVIHYGLDHISAGLKLFEFNNPLFFDSAGYLICIGYECLLKGILLELNGDIPAIHNIALLCEKIPDLNFSNLSAEFIEMIRNLNAYGKLRYPNRNDSIEVGTEWLKDIHKLINFTISKIPSTINLDSTLLIDGEEVIHKGGRVLMKKKI